MTLKQKVVQIIKHWPALYRFVSKIYFALQFQHLLERLLGTRAAERRWAHRSIAEGYWANRDLPSKHFLAERIAAFQPLHSILELGCASGPNLYVLAKRFPETQIVGIDINAGAIQYGNTQLAQEGISNTKLLIGKIDELDEFQDGAFDVTFTNACLIYIGPDKIKKVIKGMLRVTNKALVLLELHRFEPNRRDSSGLGTYLDGSWVRDYLALLRQFVPKEQIRITKIPAGIWPAKPWEELGAIAEVLIGSGK